MEKSQHLKLHDQFNTIVKTKNINDAKKEVSMILQKVRFRYDLDDRQRDDIINRCNYFLKQTII